MESMEAWADVFAAAGFSAEDGEGEGTQPDGDAVLARFAGHVKRLCETAQSAQARAEEAELRGAVAALGINAPGARMDGCLRLARAYRADGMSTDEAAQAAADAMGLLEGAQGPDAGRRAGGGAAGDGAPGDAWRAVAAGRGGGERDWASMGLAERAALYRRDAPMARAMARAAGERLQ